MGLLTRDYLFIYFLKVTVLLFWGGALSDERSGLSCVSLVIEVYSSLSFVQHIYINITIYGVEHFYKTVRYLNIFTKVVKYIQYIIYTGLVQSRLRTADYALFTSYLVYHGSFRHLNSRTRDRRQV
jgi:hypothetical protein